MSTYAQRETSNGALAIRDRTRRPVSRVVLESATAVAAAATSG